MILRTFLTQGCFDYTRANLKTSTCVVIMHPRLDDERKNFVKSFLNFIVRIAVSYQTSCVYEKDEREGERERKIQIV